MGNKAEEAVNEAKPGIRFVLGVWGEWHTRMMVELNFGSLLAPGNIPALAEKYPIIFHIFTGQSERTYIERSPEFQALKQWCKFEFTSIDSLIAEDPIAAHKEPWMDGAREAKKNGEYVAFFHPDVVWSDGSFRHIAKLLDAGKKAIFNSFLRVVSHTFSPDIIKSHKRGPNGLIQVPPRQLVELGLSHLHPIFAAYDRNSRCFPIHAEMVVWPVPGEGIHMRILAREMFLFDPNCITHTHQLLLKEAPSEDCIEIIGESDDLFAVSLTPFGKDIGWHETSRALSPPFIAKWMEIYQADWNHVTASVPINWSVRDTNTARWQRRARASGIMVRRFQNCCRATWVWRMATHLNMSHLSAEMISYLIINDFLYKLPESPRLTAVIIPEDRALAPYVDGLYKMLEKENESAFLEMIMDYLVVDVRAEAPFHTWVKPGETVFLETLSGRPLEIKCSNDGTFELNSGRLFPPEGVRADNLLLYTSNRVCDQHKFLELAPDTTPSISSEAP